MRKQLVLAGLLGAAGLLNAQNLDIVPAGKINFKVGEEIPFTVTAKKDKKQLLKEGTFTLSFHNSGGKKIQDDLTIDLANGNPVKVTTKLDHPGFVLIKASNVKTADGKTVKWNNHPFAPLGGAAVEPEKIVTGSECPEDFDQFWQEGIKSFENAKITVKPAPEIKRNGFKVSRFTVEFPDGSGLVDGFLSIPDKPGKYPAHAGVPGAGSGKADPIPRWPSPVPAIELWLNVQNFRTGADQKEQRERNGAYVKSLGGAFWFSGAKGRDTYFYRKVWLVVNRAVDYVATLPEYDGKHFAMVGNSQGGGTALAVGSMNKNITCIVATVPALCDHGGWKAGRQAGWPQLHANLKGKADPWMSYFDGANFAARIKVPTLVSVGYIDVTCSPASVYAAFNAIPENVQKTIFPMPRSGHRGTGALTPVLNKFLKEQLTK